MRGRVFLDTNIFFYLYSNDEPIKRQNVEAAINLYDCITSTQAINELSNVFIKKLKLSKESIKAAINEIASFCTIIKLDIMTINLALDLHSEYNYSYYDCLMLATALVSGCVKIFTEDMQNGQVIRNTLTIKNIVIGTAL